MKLEQQNHLVIKHVLEQPIDNFKSKAEQKAKMYYESCLDVNDTIEELGAKPMLQLLRELGGWNVTDSGFNVTKFGLQATLQKVQNRYVQVKVWSRFDRNYIIVEFGCGSSEVRMKGKRRQGFSLGLEGSRRL